MHLTLQRLLIIIGVVAALAGGGAAWLWQYAWSPQGRARNILVQFTGQNRGLRPWLVSHHLTRPVVFDVPPQGRTDLAAAELLGEIGPDATLVILEALRDSNPAVRKVAAMAAGMVHDQPTFEPLIQCLRDEDEDVQESAAVALGEFGPQAAKPLMERFKVSKLLGVKAAVPESLVRACGDQATPLLAELLEKDDYYNTAVVQALGQCHGEQVLTLLLRLTKDETIGDGAGCEAIRGLGKFKDRRAADAAMALLHNIPDPNAVDLMVWGRGVARATAAADAWGKWVSPGRFKG